MTSGDSRAMRAALTGGVILLAAAFFPGCNLGEAVRAHGVIGESLSRPAESGLAAMEVRGRVPIVHLYGTPAEMGEQYGTLLRKPLTALRAYLYVFLNPILRERLVAQARKAEPSLPDAFREELRALAKASGMPYDELVALNVLPKISCSALAVWGAARDAGGPGGAGGGDPNLSGILLGRNGDYFPLGLADRGMVLTVRHPKEGLATASANFLGMIGDFTGVNERGVCYANFLVFNAAGPQYQPGGLPIQIALRQSAQKCGTAAEMARELESLRHVIPMNVMVADANEAIVLELGLAATRRRTGKDGVLAVTNTFLTDLRAAPMHCPRYDALLGAARDNRGRMGVAEMQAALHAALLPGLNLQAVVFEPAAMRVHVSINRLPASAGPYETLDLRELFRRAPR